MTILNPNTFSSSETWFNPVRDKKLKEAEFHLIYLNELEVRKPLVVFILQRSKEMRLYNLV
jgi:hypothetical protein